MTTDNVNDNKDNDIKTLKQMKEKLAKAFDTSTKLAETNKKIGCFSDARSFQKKHGRLCDCLRHSSR